MILDYCQLLSEVLSSQKENIPMKPSLTFNKDGWSFNGMNFGNDEAAAKRARDDYYNPNDLIDVL